MRLKLIAIAIFLTASAGLSYAELSRPDCLNLLSDSRRGERVWPNFKDPKQRANAIETLGVTRFADKEDPLQAMLNSLATSPPEYAATRRKMYYNLVNRYGYIIKNGNGAKFFHGSNSASLVSVMKMEKGPRGLVPTGKLLEQGEVPFSGELLPGISEGGVNHNNLSVTTFNYLDLAFQYATKTDGYNPELSAKNIVEFSKLVKKFKDSNRELMAGAATARIGIEQKRIVQWEHIDPLEKELIERDFPVLYGIKRLPGQKPEGGIHTRAGTWETLIPDGVKPEEIVSIFVPADQVEFVRGHLAFENGIEVSPIEPALSQAMQINDFYHDFSKGISEGD